MNATTNQEARALTLSGASSTGLVLSSDTMDKAFRMAELMAAGRATVPKHLQGSVADCMAVTLQALQWNMSPFAVAQKTHLVNGTLGYEAQLVNAVLQSTGAIVGEFEYEYSGEGDKMACRVGAIPRGKKEVVWGEWLGISAVTTKNSPLWKTNPKQQIAYLQVKNWARLYKPGAILGVYTADELEAPGEKFMGPAEVVPQSPAHYPAAEFDKNLPAWRRAIEAGKKTAADLIAMVETKGALTDEQKATLRAIKPPQPDVQDVQPKDEALAFTYAQVADKLTNAADMERLAEAGSLIGAVSNADHRAELVTLYEQRSAEMEAA